MQKKQHEKKSAGEGVTSLAMKKYGRNLARAMNQSGKSAEKPSKES